LILIVYFPGILVALPLSREPKSEQYLGGKMKKQLINSKISRWALILTMTTAMAGCAGGPMTTREKGVALGTLGGAAVGGAIGSAFHRPGMGAAIGAGTGLGAGALIGDYMQGQEQNDDR
jgi:YmgG-like glycine-zipper protein